MKKFATWLLSSAFLLCSASLMAQPGYYPNSNQYYPNSINNNSINWQSSYSNAVSMAQSTGKPIVLLFTGTNWCPACMKLERQVLTNPAFIQAVGQSFVFLKAEFPDYSEGAMMSSPYKPLLDRYHVDLFPTMVVINANGQQLYTVNYQNTGGEAKAYAQQLLQQLGQTQTARY